MNINVLNLEGVALYAAYGSLVVYILIELLLKGRIPVIQYKIPYLKNWYSHLHAQVKRLIAWALSILLTILLAISAGIHIKNAILIGLFTGFGSTSVNKLVDITLDKVKKVGGNSGG